MKHIAQMLFGMHCVLQAGVLHAGDLVRRDG